MNVLPAQEMKRRGVAAVDDLISKGDIHIIRNNQPQYVVLSQERYQELIEAQDVAAMSHLRASLKDLKAGRVHRFTSVDALMKELDSED